MTFTRYATYAWQNLEKSSPYATNPMKQAVISPSMMYLLYPLQGELDGYPRKAFESDLVNEVSMSSCQRLKLKDYSVRQTSVDASRLEPSASQSTSPKVCNNQLVGQLANGEGRLALKNHPDNPWTGAALLDKFVTLINQ